MKQTTEIDWVAKKAQAKRMSDAELIGARLDCHEAAQAAECLVKAGCWVSKTEGYYRDEASVYANETRTRQVVCSRQASPVIRTAWFNFVKDYKGVGEPSITSFVAGWNAHTVHNAS